MKKTDLIYHDILGTNLKPANNAPIKLSQNLEYI